jgi:hypothetical protein
MRIRTSASLCTCLQTEFNVCVPRCLAFVSDIRGWSEQPLLVTLTRARLQNGIPDSSTLFLHSQPRHIIFQVGDGSPIRHARRLL